MKFAPGKTAVAAAWLMAAAAGAWWLHRYESAVGVVGVPPARWPTGTRIPLDRDHLTLVLFAHPKCPCTRASIEELNRLLARCQQEVATHALFFQPSNYPADWSRSSLWQSAAAIPGVVAQADPDGIEAKLFGAGTSGFVVVYNPAGKLLFRGGITIARGHAGNNPGANAIVSLVNGEPPATRQTPVFGCGLLDQCTASN